MNDKLRQIVEVVYPQLTRIARRKMLRERADHPLDAVALTNEVLLRLIKRERAGEDPQRLVHDGLLEMRTILVDYGRKRKIRDSKEVHALADRIEQIPDQRPSFSEAVHLELLLEALEASHRRAAEVLRLRVFLGLTNTEIAQLLQISEKTVQRHWSAARSWLRANWKKK